MPTKDSPGTTDGPQEVDETSTEHGGATAAPDDAAGEAVESDAGPADPEGSVTEAQDQGPADAP